MLYKKPYLYWNASADASANVDDDAGISKWSVQSHFYHGVLNNRLTKIRRPPFQKNLTR